MSYQRKKLILYVIPGSQISGGVYVVLQHVNHLLLEGHDVCIYNMDGRSIIEWFDNNVTIYTPEDLVDVVSRKWDIAIATQFSTVQFVKDQIVAIRKIYFVQSDERRFALNQSDMARCVASYHISGFEYMTEARWIQGWLKEEFDRRAFYVPNGLDQKLFFQLNDSEKATFERRNPRGSKRVLLEGAINNPAKGMQDAYEAVKDLDVDIWIISNGGQPPHDWRCDQFFENVPISQMREIYGQCDVFLKMSRVEGFFGPPLEAMSCGLPVVVGKCTGYDEYIVDNENALVVKMGDIDGAKSAIMHLLRDEELRSRFVRAGLETSDYWTWERSFDSLESVLRNESVIDLEMTKELYDHARVLQESVGTFDTEPYVRLVDKTLKRDAHIEKTQALLAQRKNQLDAMQESTFWKLRNQYLKMKSFIFLNTSHNDFDCVTKNSNCGGDVRVSVDGDAMIFDSGIVGTSSETLIILVHFDASGDVNPSFLYYLAQLSKLGDVCVVSASEQLTSSSQELILFQAKRLIIKKNVGYDFKAWAMGIALHSNIRDYSRVILTNDSIFGPLQDLGGILDKMDKKDLDVWSMTDCFQRDRYHLQSYFVVYNKRPIQDGFLRSLFKDFSGLKTKDDIINAFEVGLSDQLDAQGYAYGAYASMKRISQTIETYALSRFAYEGHINPPHELWEYLIMYEKFPFLKRELVMKNPHNLDLSLLESVLRTYTDYDISLIQQYKKKCDDSN